MAPRPRPEPPSRGGPAEEPGFYLLIHQLPPRPLYLRARIRQRLERVGAVALKKSVYVLPRTAACLEDFEWLAQEAVAGGGEAFVCETSFVHGLSAGEIRERFRRAAAQRYGELVSAAREVLARLRGRRGGEREADPAGRLRRLKRRLQEATSLDFFGAQERAQAEAAIRALEARLHPPRAVAPARSGRPHGDLVGKTWVTRKGVHVDRIGSAWLIRRFVDPAAQFRFVEAHETAAREGELRFDMVKGDFTHRGDRCTFEDLVAHLGLRDAALACVAEIVHEIDLKDGKFARPEVAGVEQLLNGLCRAHAADAERLERGCQLFDDLYRSFSKPAALQIPPEKRRQRTGGRQ